MKKALPIGFLFIATIIAAPVSGAMIKGGEHISVSDSIGDDLYIAGGQVDISEGISGDLVSAGGEIRVIGDVSEDITIAAGRLNILGVIGDDARIAGGEVRINGIIKDDLFAAGGRIELAEDAEILGDVRIAGGEIFIDGEVKGNVDIRAGRIVLRGSVDGDVNVQADEITVFAEIEGTSRIVASAITLGDSALFLGDVEYWASEGEIDFTPHLQESGASFNADLAPKDWNPRTVAPTLFVTGLLINVVSSVLFAAFFIILVSFLTKNMFSNAAKKLQLSIGMSMLLGFLYFVVAPIFIILLMLSIVGIPVSIFSGFFYGFTIYFAKPITAMVLAKYIEQHKKRAKKWETWKFILISLLLFTGLKVLSLIPVIGWLILFVIVCSAYGALLGTKWDTLKQMR